MARKEKLMKRIKVLTVVLAITLMVAGCSNTKTKQSSSDSSLQSQSSIDAKYINLTMVTQNYKSYN